MAFLGEEEHRARLNSDNTDASSVSPKLPKKKLIQAMAQRTDNRKYEVDRQHRRKHLHVEPDRIIQDGPTDDLAEPQIMHSTLGNIAASRSILLRKATQARQFIRQARNSHSSSDATLVRVMKAHKQDKYKVDDESGLVCVQCELANCDPDCPFHEVTQLMRQDYQFLKDEEARTIEKTASEKRQSFAIYCEENCNTTDADLSFFDGYVSAGIFDTMHQLRHLIQGMIAKYLVMVGDDTMEVTSERAYALFTRFEFSHMRASDIIFLNNAFQTTDPGDYPNETREQLEQIFGLVTIMMCEHTGMHSVEDPEKAGERDALEESVRKLTRQSRKPRMSVSSLIH